MVGGSCSKNMRDDQYQVRPMKMKIALFLLLLPLACGCAQETPSQYVQIRANVVEGVGIPGALEIGMRLDSIADMFPEATCEPNSRASLFWWFGETWQKHPPWAKPATYKLTVPSVGAIMYERSPTNEIAQIHFTVKKEYDWPYFSGSLSGRLSFSATTAVSLAEVIARYGEPLHTLAYPSIQKATSVTNGMQFIQEQDAILASGESLLMTNDTDNPYRLHYPSRGIYFDIENGEVIAFRIFKKVELAPRPVPSRSAVDAAPSIR